MFDEKTQVAGRQKAFSRRGGSCIWEGVVQGEKKYRHGVLLSESPSSRTPSSTESESPSSAESESNLLQSFSISKKSASGSASSVSMISGVRGGGEASTRGAAMFDNVGGNSGKNPRPGEELRERTETHLRRIWLKTLKKEKKRGFFYLVRGPVNPRSSGRPDYGLRKWSSTDKSTGRNCCWRSNVLRTPTDYVQAPNGGKLRSTVRRNPRKVAQGGLGGGPGR